MLNKHALNPYFLQAQTLFDVPQPPATARLSRGRKNKDPARGEHVSEARGTALSLRDLTKAHAMLVNSSSAVADPESLLLDATRFEELTNTLRYVPYILQG